MPRPWPSLVSPPNGATHPCTDGHLAAATPKLTAPPPPSSQALDKIDRVPGTALVRSPAMSLPREIVPGTTYLITRRTLRRHLLLRPDEAITQLLVYLLAVSAPRYGLQVHALCAMSTHLHLVVTDVQGY